MCYRGEGKKKEREKERKKEEERRFARFSDLLVCNLAMLSSKVNDPVSHGTTRIWPMEAVDGSDTDISSVSFVTFNVAAIFFQGHPYIWRTTVRHDSSTFC